MAGIIEYKKAINASNGTRIDISKRLKITPSAVTQYLEKHPDIDKLLRKRRLSNIDLAESEIFKQLDFKDNKGKSSAAKIRQGASQFILKTLGKNAGWMEKSEQILEHKGEQIKVIIEEKKPDGDK